MKSSNTVKTRKIDNEYRNYVVANENTDESEDQNVINRHNNFVCNALTDHTSKNKAGNKSSLIVENKFLKPFEHASIIKYSNSANLSVGSNLLHNFSEPLIPRFDEVTNDKKLVL